MSVHGEHTPSPNKRWPASSIHPQSGVIINWMAFDSSWPTYKQNPAVAAFHFSRRSSHSVKRPLQCRVTEREDREGLLRSGPLHRSAVRAEYSDLRKGL